MNERRDYERAIHAGIHEALRRRREILEPVALGEACDRILATPVEERAAFLDRHAELARPEVCRKLGRRSHRLRHEDPDAMITIAQAAVAVGEAIGRQALRFHGLASDLQAEALGFLANAYRVKGDLEAADRTWERLRNQLPVGTGDLLLAARCDRLEGELRTDQRRYREGIRLQRRAFATYRRLRDPHRAGHALTGLGRAYRQAGRLDEAIRCAYVAGRWIDAQRAPVLSLTAMHNLVVYLDEAGHPWHALELLQRIAPLYARAPGRLLALRARWLEGRLCHGLGRSGAAIETLDEVRRAFSERGMDYDAALAALDLAAVYAGLGRHADVQELAQEMVPILASRRIDREAAVALLLFTEAAQTHTVTDELVMGIAHRIEEIRSAADGGSGVLRNL